MGTTGAGHTHLHPDNQCQKGSGGTFKGMPKGKHKVTVTGATKDHGLVTAIQSINVEVQ